MRRSTFLLFFSLALVSYGCDESSDNYLKGSAVDTYKIGFNKTRVLLHDNSFAVEYLNNSEQIALGVYLGIGIDVLAEGIKYDIKKESGSIGRNRDLGSPLPEIESGELELDVFSPKKGSDVEGTFEAVLITADKTRQTIRGGFAAKLEIPGG